jgi:hypothetical protein
MTSAEAADLDASSCESELALVALMRFYPRTRHDLVPEEKEHNDDRDWNAEQPEKCASSHSCLLLCVKDNGAGSSKFLCIRTRIKYAMRHCLSDSQTDLISRRNGLLHRRLVPDFPQPLQSSGFIAQ